MRSNESQQQTLASIETLNIFAQNSGKSVPLLQVASIDPQWQYAKIKRLDIDRTINVSSELNATGNASFDNENNDTIHGGNFYKLARRL